VAGFVKEGISKTEREINSFYIVTFTRVIIAWILSIRILSIRALIDYEMLIQGHRSSLKT
jgi:hypothetical protein